MQQILDPALAACGNETLVAIKDETLEGLIAPDTLHSTSLRCKIAAAEKHDPPQHTVTSLHVTRKV